MYQPTNYEYTSPESYNSYEKSQLQGRGIEGGPLLGYSDASTTEERTGNQDSLRTLIGVFYLEGGMLLVPGFLWIIPEKVEPLPFPPFEYVPIFDEDNYERGMNWLIFGLGLIIVAAITDLILCGGGPESRAIWTRIRSGGQERPPIQNFGKWFSLLLQVVAAAILIGGCIPLLPKYSLQKPPAEIWGMESIDLGNLFFQAGSVLYFISSIIAIVGVSFGILNARREGRSTLKLWSNLLAFVLFILTSCLFFVNGLLSDERAIEAGRMRLAASISLLIAIILLCIDTFSEICIS